MKDAPHLSKVFGAFQQKVQPLPVAQGVSKSAPNGVPYPGKAASAGTAGGANEDEVPGSYGTAKEPEVQASFEPERAQQRLRPALGKLKDVKVKTPAHMPTASPSNAFGEVRSYQFNPLLI